MIPQCLKQAKKRFEGLCKDYGAGLEREPVEKIEPEADLSRELAHEGWWDAVILERLDECEEVIPERLKHHAHVCERMGEKRLARMSDERHPTSAPSSRFPCGPA